MPLMPSMVRVAPRGASAGTTGIPGLQALALPSSGFLLTLRPPGELGRLDPEHPDPARKPPLTASHTIPSSSCKFLCSARRVAPRHHQNLIY